MGVCPSWKPPTSFVPLRSLAAGVATSSITAVDPYPLMCAVLAVVLATALVLSSVRNYFKHVEEKKRKKKNARESRENRDTGAAPWPRKELLPNETRSSYTSTIKPKPLEPVTKSSQSYDVNGLAAQSPKKPDTTVQPSTEPVAKTPPPPPPKPTVSPLAPALPITDILQNTSPFAEISSVREITTSRVSKESLAFHDSKFLVDKTSVPQHPAQVQLITNTQDLNKDLLSKLPELSTHVAPSMMGTDTTKAHEVQETAIHNFTSSGANLQTAPEISPFSCLTKSAENNPPETAYSPFSTLDSQLHNLRPSILGALESELDAFRSSWAPETTKQAERRQEVSMETTSLGQQYHSLTSETKSWSSGPRQEVNTFLQSEDIGRAEGEPSRHFTTFTSDRKQEDVQKLRPEYAPLPALPHEQHQLEPPVVDLSWRPSSPIFNQPLQPPGESFAPLAESPTPAPLYEVPRAPTKFVQEDRVSPVWSPPSAKSDAYPSQPPKREVQREVPRPYRKGRKAQSRPSSAPPMDREIWDPYSDTELVYWQSSSAQSEVSRLSKRTSVSSKAISDSEDWCNLNTSDDEMGSSSLYNRRKKMYSSSSFYEEPHSIYPTVEEQVELARKIAGSLSNDNNRKSKGASMFFKRVKRANSWIHEGQDPFSDGGFTDTDMEPTTPDPGTGPYVKVSTGPPKLKLILDPRQLQDLDTLRSSGLNPVDHAAVSPDICLDLVRDMNSPIGKGAALFAKRKQKAENWVVDEEKVKQQIAQKEAEIAQLREETDFPFGPRVPRLLVQNRLKMVKSPWEAALQSTVGSCESAFVELPPVVANVASSIIRAAEKKARTNLAAQPYSDSSSVDPADVYTPKAPIGWMGPATGSVPSVQRIPSPPPVPRDAAPAPMRSGRMSSGAPRPYSFHDFNSFARTWSSAPKSQHTFRHVEPPSNFLTKSKPFGH